MNEFSLTITMGSDAMQDGLDVADALRSVADDVRAGVVGGVVTDANGNTCGTWRFEEQS